MKPKRGKFSFHWKRLGIPIFAAFLVAGCTGPQLLVRSSAALVKLGALALQEEEDLALAEEATAAQLKLVEGMLKADPRNPDLLLLLSQGFGGYAFAFVELEDPDRAASFYRRGLLYGWRLIDRYSGLTHVLAGHDEAAIRRALAKLPAEAVPGLFWTAYNWAGWINLNRDDPEALADYWKVEAMMARVLELDEAYYDGGAHLFFAVALSSRPPLLGGNLEEAKKHYEKVVSLTQGKFLLAHVLFASSYAVQAQDRELFLKLCRMVLRAPPTMTSRWKLLNAVARQRASMLLEDIDEYF
jgi:tetratricopeptide (TPR) repeat protein